MRKYRVYIGKFDLYLNDSFVSLTEAEKAGLETNYNFSVENERREILIVKGEFEEILRIPERPENENVKR